MEPIRIMWSDISDPDTYGCTCLRCRTERDQHAKIAALYYFWLGRDAEEMCHD